MNLNFMNITSSGVGGMDAITKWPIGIVFASVATAGVEIRKDFIPLESR